MDPIADALIRIKNGYQVGKEKVQVRYSKLIWRLMKLLEKEGYIESSKEIDKQSLPTGRQIEVTLKYESRKPVLTDIKRVSKPSLRVYGGVKNLPRVLSGLGIAIISTPKGLMTDKQARREKVGGEILALVW